MDKYLRWGIYAGIFAILFIPFLVTTPLFFPFITGKGFAFRIIVEVIFALWVILALRNVDARPRWSTLLVAVVAFIATLGVSTMLSENPSKSLWSNFERMEGWVLLVHLGAFFTVLTSTLRSQKIWRTFFNTSVVASVLMGLFGLFQLWGVFEINQGGVRVDGTFGNATYLAVYMLFHFFITLLALVKWSTATWMRVGYGVALILQGVMIFFAATRGTTLGLLGGLLLAGIIFTLFAKGHKKLRMIGVSAVALVVILVGGFFAIKDTSFVQNNDVLVRFANIAPSEAQTRFTTWTMALQGGFERPVFGWGQESFNYIFNERYTPSLYGQEPWFDRAHNAYLDWFVAGGFPAALLFLSFFLIPFWYLVKKGSPFDTRERAVLIGLLAAYGFHEMFVFDNLMSYVMFLSIIGFILVRYQLGQPTHEQSNNLQPTSSALPALLKMVLSGVVVVLLVASLYFVNVPGLTQARGVIAAIQPYEEGIVRNLEEFKTITARNTGLGRQEVHEQLVQFAVQVQGENLASLSTPEFRNEVAQYTISEMEEEIARTPHDARLRVFYGSFLRTVGAIDAAREQLHAALELSPQKQSILFELGILESEQGNMQESLGYFKQAFELETAYDQARIFYAATAIRAGEIADAQQLLIERYDTATPDNGFILQAYIDIGDIESALAIAQLRVANNPQDPNLRLQLAGAYLELGQRSTAIEVVRSIIEIDPTLEAQIEQIVTQIETGQI